jgi:hypothetical protein
MIFGSGKVPTANQGRSRILAQDHLSKIKPGVHLATQDSDHQGDSSKTKKWSKKETGE